MSHLSQAVFPARTYPSFCSIKQLEVLSLIPPKGDPTTYKCCQVGLTVSWYPFTVWTWVERSTVQVSAGCRFCTWASSPVYSRLKFTPSYLPLRRLMIGTISYDNKYHTHFAFELCPWQLSQLWEGQRKEFPQWTKHTEDPTRKTQEPFIHGYICTQAKLPIKLEPIPVSVA